MVDIPNKLLAKGLEGKTLDAIVGIYGWKYFEQVR